LNALLKKLNGIYETIKSREKLVWFLFILANYYCYLRLSIGTPICFDDCHDYINLMGSGTYDEFLKNYETVWRPWFLPLFYWLFGNYDLASAANIMLAQTTIQYISWIIFAKVVSGLFTGKTARIVFLAVSLSAYIQQYYVFNKFLKSDSMALALVLLLFSLVFGFDKLIRKIGFWWGLLLLALCALFAAGTRDSIVMLVILGMAYVILLNRNLLKRWQILLVFLCLTAVSVNQVIHFRERQSYTTSHIIAGFVLPDPEIRKNFTDMGMPETIGLGFHLNSQPWCSANYQQILGGLYAMKIPMDFIKKAPNLYMRWLLSHPFYILKQSYNDLDCILGQSFTESPSFHFGKYPTSEVSFPRPGEKVITIQQGLSRISPSDFLGIRTKLVLAALCSAFLLIVLFKRRDAYISAPLFLVFSGVLNAVASYFSDLWEPSEMLRHAFIGSILFNVGVMISAISVVYFFICRRKKAEKS